ncbi:MAG TPA: phytoene desaturase family protein [Solirubrobacteraceae bacterium]|nr:phytoene desaturase family protein [Solirubrobacteraceae bacterium]
MRVIVIGAGLGGLAVALRLQGMGAEVTVVERAPSPGGRASQLRDGPYTWDTGPSLITMPWVLEESFAAGGLDLAREVTLRQLDPLYRIRWAGEERTFEFSSEREALTAQVARFSEADARRLPEFLAALAPIYEQGMLDAGRRPMQDVRSFVGLLPTMSRLRAAGPLYDFVARYFQHPRVREAFSFHSLFIGGDPFRVPAIYGALVHLQIAEGGWYTDGGVYSLVKAMARPLDIRCGATVERIETSGGRASGVRLQGGERIDADVVVSGADVLRTDRLLGRGASLRRLRPTMSCFLLYLGLDRAQPRLRHHTLLVGPDYREFIRTVTRGRTLPGTLSTYVHAPARTEPGMASPGGDSLAILLPVPNLAADVDWPGTADALRARVIDDLERVHGLEGLGASIRAEHRWTPLDFAERFLAVDGNAFSVEPTLNQSALGRPGNRVGGVDGVYRVGAGTHPGAGIPGVLLGAAVTAGLIAADAGRRTRIRPPRDTPAEQAVTEARAVTERRATTFALACRLLPADVRDDVYLLYLIFRTLDDLVDDGAPAAARRVAAVAAWARRAGGEVTEETRALSELAARHPIPRDAVAAFCEGMEQDLAGPRFTTEREVDRYCYRVAGTVGVVIAAILGSDEPEEARACAAALGMAMQRTNILRDIDEDRAAGRVYVSDASLGRYGGSLAPGDRGPLVRALIARADALYEEGLAGVRTLRRGRGAILVAARLYREILREIERSGLGATPGRAVVPARRRLAVLAGTAVGAR